MTESDAAATDPERPLTVPDAARHLPVQGAGVSMAASQLHVADLIEQDGSLQRVTSLRLQGAPPTVSVALTGVPGRRSFPPETRLVVVRGR